MLKAGIEKSFLQILFHDEHWGFVQLFYLKDFENFHADNVQDPDNTTVNQYYLLSII